MRTDPVWLRPAARRHESLQDYRTYPGCYDAVTSKLVQVTRPTWCLQSDRNATSRTNCAGRGCCTRPNYTTRWSSTTVTWRSAILDSSSVRANTGAAISTKRCRSIRTDGTCIAFPCPRQLTFSTPEPANRGDWGFMVWDAYVVAVVVTKCTILITQKRFEL